MDLQQAADSTIAKASARILMPIMVAVLLVLLSVCGWRPRPRPAAVVVAGAASGLLGTATSIGGPPMAMALHHSGGPAMRGTLSAFFLLGSLLSVGLLAAVLPMCPLAAASQELRNRGDHRADETVRLPRCNALTRHHAGSEHVIDRQRQRPARADLDEEGDEDRPEARRTGATRPETASRDPEQPGERRPRHQGEGAVAGGTGGVQGAAEEHPERAG